MRVSSLPHTVSSFVVHSHTISSQPHPHTYTSAFICTQSKWVLATLPMTCWWLVYEPNINNGNPFFFSPLTPSSPTTHILLWFHRKTRQWADKHHISFNCVEHRCAAPPAHTYQQRQQTHELFRTCQRRILIACSKMKVQKDTFPWEIFEAIQ